MITKSIIRNLVLIAVLILLIFPTTAQDETDNAQRFLEMLAFVPDTEEARQELYYADVQTAIETRPGTPQFNSMDEWYDADEEERDWWVNGLPQTFLIMEYFRHMLADGGDSTGIDIFTVKRLLAFGQPPAQAMILQGDFDNAAITNAYTSNGWEVARNENDITLLCSIEGCENGLEVNPQGREQANPFGGLLGRVEPIALADGFIFNSADITVLEEILRVQNEDVPSLADAPDVQAAVNALAEQGIIRQAAMVEPDFVGVFDSLSPTFGEGIEEQITFLPPYDLFMIAETADIDAQTQTAHVALVYQDTESAEDAVLALESNLQPDGVISVRIHRPFYDLLNERGNMLIQHNEYTEHNRHVVLLSLQAPIVTADTQEDGQLIMSGMQFRFFLQVVFARDTLWLATSLAESE